LFFVVPKYRQIVAKALPRQPASPEQISTAHQPVRPPSTC
jgi:hypothetical protein